MNFDILSNIEPCSLFEGKKEESDNRRESSNTSKIFMVIIREYHNEKRTSSAKFAAPTSKAWMIMVKELKCDYTEELSTDVMSVSSLCECPQENMGYDIANYAKV